MQKNDLIIFALKYFRKKFFFIKVVFEMDSSWIWCMDSSLLYFIERILANY